MTVNVRHTNKTLRRMDDDPDFNGGFSSGIAKAFRMRMHLIRAIGNEDELRARKSYRFEKLKGARSSDDSIRLNDQFRLTFQIEKSGGGNRLVILAIEDYH
jgi:proteic killer suppression protein